MAERRPGQILEEHDLAENSARQANGTLANDDDENQTDRVGCVEEAKMERSAGRN